MVRKARLSIAGLMGIVLVAALGLTALRSASEVWAGVAMLVTLGVLALGIVGVACRGGAERAWWLGFVLFGCGYMLMVYLFPHGSILYLPTTALVEILRPIGGSHDGRGGLGTIGYFFVTCHSLFGLAFAVVGGLLAVFLFRGQTARPEAVVSPMVEARALRRGWRRPAVVVPAAFVVGAAVVLAGLRWAPVIMCGVTVFVTWGLLVLAAVGAACRRARARAAWLGAALFGIGYMVLIFGANPERPDGPRAATHLLLRALRPSWYLGEFPPPSAEAVVTNAWIREVFSRPIPMRYAQETPLEDVLKAIQFATQGPDGRRLFFYVDSAGLQEVERTLASPITIDLEGVPLRTTLAMILSQLDLTYEIQEGLVYITSERARDQWPFSVGVDPYLTVGHCLLALLAAGLGAVLARWFCTPKDAPTAAT
jgi:hypothetical protein